MSSANAFARHRKIQLDCAIGRAYSRLTGRSRGREAFTCLLRLVQARAPSILSAPVVQDHHLGVEALFQLSRIADFHVRPIARWPGSGASWRGAVGTLAQHLLGRYPMPRFLASAWYAIDAHSRAKRRWYLAHADGASFRSLDLPILMTRRMEHVFLGSQDHMSIEYAMRRAELIGLRVPDAFVEAVLATRLASELTNSAFWRTLWWFLIAHASDIAAVQIGPIVDYLQAIRHERSVVETTDGLVLLDPPQPRYSLKGRTAYSLLRAMEAWHRGLGLVAGGLSWQRSPWRSMKVEAVPREPLTQPQFWELTELTNGEQLRAEGAALHHCVASYSYRCWRGASRIWSLRRRSGSRSRPVLTIEIDPRTSAIVQARGYQNRSPSGKALELLKTWAARENLRLRL